MKLPLAALLALLSLTSFADQSQDAAILKARTLPPKFVVKAAPQSKPKEGFLPLPQALGKLKRGCALVLAPGFYGPEEIKIDEDGIIIEGDPDASFSDIMGVFEINGDNCVIRRVNCGLLRVKRKLSVVDSRFKTLSFAAEEGKKAKCSLLAANCVFERCELEGPKDYEVKVVRNGKTEIETVKVSGGGCEFSFKNCVLSGESIFRLSGDISLEFSKCVISGDDAFNIDRSHGGKSSIVIEDSVVFQSKIPGDLIKTLRKAAGQATSKGKLLCVDKAPFSSGEPYPSNLKDLVLPEGSPGALIEAGISLDANGALAPSAKEKDAKKAPKAGP